MNLKVVIICATILLAPFKILGQHTSDTTSYAKKAQAALQTKKTGATITILGALALTIGLITVNSDLDVGAAIGTAGLVGTGIGLPIWIIGSHNYKKYTRKAQGLPVRLKATPQQSGLTLTYRF